MPARRRLAASAAVAVVALLVVVALASSSGIGGDDGRSEAAEGAAGPQALAPPQLEPARARPIEDPSGTPSVRWSATILAAAVATAAVGMLAFARSRRPEPSAPEGEGELVAELAAAVDAAFVGLEDEPDPRRAVIAAYARMERALSAHGLARRPFEAPLEYLARIAPSLDTARPLVFELTHLYERARFSPHEIDLEMKTDAIETLAALRDELRVAA